MTSKIVLAIAAVLSIASANAGAADQPRCWQSLSQISSHGAYLEKNQLSTDGTGILNYEGDSLAFTSGGSKALSTLTFKNDTLGNNYVFFYDFNVTGQSLGETLSGPAGIFSGDQYIKGRSFDCLSSDLAQAVLITSPEKSDGGKIAVEAKCMMEVVCQ